MTTYNAQSHVAIGDLYTASMHNTVIDNIHAFWTNAVAGGMPYWSAANVVAALAKPTVLSLLTHNGTIPVWLNKGTAHQVLRVNSAGTGLEFGSGGVKAFSHANATSYSYSTATWRDMPNSSVSVTVDVTSTLIVIAFIKMFGTGTYGFFDAKFNIDGTDQDNFAIGHTYNINNVDTLPMIGIKTGVTAGSKTVKIREYCSAAGYTVDAKGFIGLVIPE
ncbi:MAG: hypothetical protein CVU44_11370 [Chloroflexi bacterium HGW-Chloroflexi-6]|nr:MAG: hypothetical protein CVU44_11370 [Chloroflexi bacterium HGW-Chloroflexi-6]